MSRHDYPPDDDGEALRRIAEGGSDMTLPMAIDFFVAVPDEESGRKVAEVAAAAGYEARLEYDEPEEDEPDDDEPDDDEPDDEEPEGSLTCCCTRTMVPTYDAVVAAQAELERLAEPFGGFTDGWGTFGNAGES